MKKLLILFLLTASVAKADVSCIWCASSPTADSIMSGNGTKWTTQSLAACLAPATIMTYEASTNTFACVTAASIATPGGSDGQVQYNNGGTAFGGMSGVVWDDTNNLLVLTETNVQTSGLPSVIDVEATCTPSSNSSGSFTGVTSEVTKTGASNIVSTYGIFAEGIQSGAGTIHTNTGAQIDGYAVAPSGTGLIDLNSALFSFSGGEAGSNITTDNTIWIETPVTGGTINTHAGLYIADQNSSATTDYSILQVGNAANSFAGAITDSVSVSSPFFQSNAGDPAEAGLFRCNNGNNGCILAEASPAGTDGEMQYTSSENWAFKNGSGTVEINPGTAGNDVADDAAPGIKLPNTGGISAEANPTGTDGTIAYTSGNLWNISNAVTTPYVLTGTFTADNTNGVGCDNGVTCISAEASPAGTDGTIIFNSSEQWDLSGGASQILAPVGIASLPGISFTGQTGYGMWTAGNGIITLSANGSSVLSVSSGGIGPTVRSNNDYSWCSTAADTSSCTIDTMIIRGGAGEVGFDNNNGQAAGVRERVIIEAVTSTKTPSEAESHEVYRSGDADGSTVTLPNDPNLAGFEFTVCIDTTQTSNNVAIAPSAGESIQYAGSSYTTSCTATAIGSCFTVVNTTTGSGAKWVATAVTGTWTCS